MPTLDTNVFGDANLRPQLMSGRLTISFVVAQELLARADRKDHNKLMRLFDVLQEKKIIVNPSGADWMEVGKCFAHLSGHRFFGKKLDTKEKKAVLVKDALIVACSRSVDSIVITRNTRDFELLCQYFRSVRFLTPEEYSGSRSR
jgi:predicted nucleic acid-binding protein